MYHLALHIGIADADGFAVLLNRTISTGIAKGITQFVSVGECHGVTFIVEEPNRLLVDTFRNDTHQHNVINADEFGDIRIVDIVLQDINGRLHVICRNLANLRQRLGTIGVFRHLTLDVGIVEGVVLECFLNISIARECPHLNVIAEFQRIRLFAYTADERRTFPFGLHVITIQDSILSGFTEVWLYQQWIPKDVLGIIFANFVVHAKQFQIEVVIFVIFLVSVIFLIVIVDGWPWSLRDIIGYWRLGNTVCLIWCKEEIFALATVLYKGKAEV